MNGLLKFLFILFFFVIIGCQSTSKKTDKSLQTLDDDDSIIWRQLTFLGENTRPQIDPKSRLLFYLSSHRSEHIQPQIYQYDLQKNKEKRVTYQFSPIADFSFYSQSNSLLISSSMDEDEENPQFLALATSQEANDIFSRYPSSLTKDNEYKIPQGLELYTFSLSNSSIVRKTKNPGYDSDMTYNNKSKSVYFISDRLKKKEIFFLNLEKDKVSLFHETPNKIIFPLSSDVDESLVWIEKNPLTNKYYILQKKLNEVAEVLYDSDSEIHSLAWAGHEHAKQIILSKKQMGTNSYNLYTINLETRCENQITRAPSSQLFPYYDEKDQSLYFSSNKTGKFQIFSMKFVTESCDK